MHIDLIRIFRVQLEAPEPDATEPDEPASDNPAPDIAVPRESLLVALHSGPHVGWGEVALSVAPVETAEWSAGAFACLANWFAPAVVGREISSGESLAEQLAPYPGNHAAKSALDGAWWALSAAIRQTPLHQLLGATRSVIPLSASIGVMDSTDDLFMIIASLLALGSEPITLKFRPGWDVEMLRAVRQAFPAVPLAIDCDGTSTLAQQEMFFRLEDFFLKHIEQPLPADDLVGHAMLQENLRTPIMLDQSITSVARAEQAIDLGACRALRIDPARMGGLTPALAICKLAEEAKVHCAAGGGPHGAIAASATAALAARCGGSLPSDSYAWLSAPWLRTDGAPTVKRSSAGKFEITLGENVPGSGIVVDAEILAEAAVEHAILRG